MKIVLTNIFEFPSVATWKHLNRSLFNNLFMPDEKLAKAIYSKVRRDILHILYKKDKVSVHEVADKLNITESSASKNLKLLYYLGFIDFETVHPEKFYFLKIKEIRELFDVYDRIVKRMKK